MDFNISSDKRYLQLENQIVDLETGIKFNVDVAHPAIVCEMFKHQFSHSYKMKLMETNDLFSKMKELIYPFINHNRDLVSEYEVRYGMNLIHESADEFNYGTFRTIEESWDFVKSKVLEVFPMTPGDLFEDSWVGDLWDKGVNAVKKGAQWVGDKLKQAGQWILNKGLPWFFEKLESFLLSPVGIGIDVALTAIGIGKIATTLLWGSLGVWKIYQLFSGKIPNDIWSYIDIAICLVGLVFTGGAAKGIKAGVKGLGRDVRKIAGSPILKPIVQLLSKGLNFIMSAIIKPIEWLAKTLGGPKIQEMINVAKNKLKDVFAKLEQATNPAKQVGLRKTLQKGVKSDIVNPAAAAMKGKGPVSVGKAARKGLTWGLATHGAMKGIEQGAKAYGDMQVAKQTEKAKQALTQLASDEKVMQQTISTSLDDALSQMNALDNQ
jgi:hypothetical protein